MQRLEGVDSVRDAARAGSVVVACAYSSRVPDDIRAQLPKDAGRQFVARVVDGKVVEVIPGLPEEAILHLLPGPVAE